ncbi:hypothetical protein GCM10027447_29430 [Glycomyces halotolerans]
MTVTSVDKDFDSLTLTLVADFDSPVEEVWRLWADPRRLEGWWGPPGYPATFERHRLEAGGEMSYFMTGPEGDKHYGWWKVTAVDPPNSLAFTDGFSDEQGNPSGEMPVTTAKVRLTERDGGTRMELRSFFESREEMERLDEMGMAEGLRQAVGQMDGLLAELPAQSLRVAGPRYFGGPAVAIWRRRVYAESVDYIDSIRYFDGSAARHSTFRTGATALPRWERSTNQKTPLLERSDH